MPPALATASALVQTVIYAVLLVNLFRLGLAPVYRGFTALVVFEPIRLLVALAIPRNSTLYGWFYLLTQPIQWTLYALVTLEVYKSVFRTLTGISKLTRYVILTATAVAVAVSSASLLFQSTAASPHRTLEIYFSVERSIFLSLLVFLLILVLFLAWYPVPVHKNAVVYTGVFALYFGVKACAFLIRTVGGPSFALSASIAIVLSSLTSGVLWIFLLTREGESRPAKPVHRMSPEDETMLIAKLEALNRTLLRSAPEKEGRCKLAGNTKK